MSIEIYDTTLRDGEQAAGARFRLNERVQACQILDDFGVDFIELGWPISEEVLRAFKECVGKTKKSKIVAFGSTSIKPNPEEDKNLNSLVESGAHYACIFGKSCLEHVRMQLKITPEENLKRISDSIKFLKNNKIHVFYDAEHYFDAFKSDKEYAIKTLITAVNAGAERIILCDTKGGLLPTEAREIMKKTKETLEKNNLNPILGVHFHNDCGLALANTLTCLDYVNQVQGTMNGMGERVGNLNLSEFLPVYIKKMKQNKEINLKELKKVNEILFKLAGVEVPEIRAFVGDIAFAHKGGVHTDATSKGASYEHEDPEEFGNKRIILLNTLGGGSCVASVAKEFGYDLDKKNPEVKEKIKKLFKELENLETKGYRIGPIKAEQFLLIEKYFGKLKEFIKIEKWKVKTSFDKGKEISEFYVKCKINGEIIEEKLKRGGGPVGTAYKTFIKILSKKYPGVEELKLIDFHVSISQSHNEESSVRTLINFSNGENFECVGVNHNILQSSIEALVKGFNYHLNKTFKNT
ncbi:MAG: citramalate synthase [Nanoarchaeota archaeon]|nr:citramalate synthase [Nanoarchaeota archaeon]MBU4116323.1 citramalate synthase [Nanoarchaeota archaeon]